MAVMSVVGTDHRLPAHARVREDNERRGEMFKTVIWATDGSEGADAALQEALELAKLSDGRIVAVHCDHRLHGRAAAYPALADEEDVRDDLRRRLDELKSDGIDIGLVIRRSHLDAAEVVASVAAELGGRRDRVRHTRIQPLGGRGPRQLHSAAVACRAVLRSRGARSRRGRAPAGTAREGRISRWTVVALGGNAFLCRSERPDAATQRCGTAS